MGSIGRFLTDSFRFAIEFWQSRSSFSLRHPLGGRFLHLAASLNDAVQNASSIGELSLSTLFGQNGAQLFRQTVEIIVKTFGDMLCNFCFLIGHRKQKIPDVAPETGGSGETIR
jgi:hypothetical protein